jgi:hypothetical protein
LIKKCNDVILNSLLNSNECFKSSYRKNPEIHKPIINIVPFNTGIFAEKNSTVKHVYTK